MECFLSILTNKQNIIPQGIRVLQNTDVTTESYRISTANFQCFNHRESSAELHQDFWLQICQVWGRSQRGTAYPAVGNTGKSEMKAINSCVTSTIFPSTCHSYFPHHNELEIFSNVKILYQARLFSLHLPL